LIYSNAGTASALGFDGGSTMKAEGHSSDRGLIPIPEDAECDMLAVYYSAVVPVPAVQACAAALRTINSLGLAGSR
jgi:hypothetical protein